MHKKLEEIDPEEKRFNRYHLPDPECGLNNVIFQRYLVSLDSRKMTKKQYRYLRDSIQLLHKHDISHGDLPNNVMLDKDDNLPRIIDWDDAKLNTDSINKQIDMTAFMGQFKVEKKN